MDTFRIEPVDSWKKAQEFFETWADEQKKSEGTVRWIFRGQKFAAESTKESTLKTSIETAFESFGVEGADRFRWERDIIREFRRKLPLYMPSTPGRHDLLEWLALMQHHKAPTRLLDWTYSPWVALHFAVNRLNEGEIGEVWALDAKWFSDKTNPIFEACNEWQDGVGKWKDAIAKRADVSYMDEGAVEVNARVMQLIHSPKTLVYNVNPFRLNERLTIQQGVFLMPGDISVSFVRNLQDNIYGSQLYERIHILHIEHANRNEMLQGLRRMNITNAVLFPGVDGFSESLWTRLAIPYEDLRAAYPDSL